MKRCLKCGVFLCLASLNVLLCYAFSDNIKEDEGIQVFTPQTWSFMKYGNVPVNLYTGTVNVEIPLYTYKDKDFTLPLSLKYASNGCIPNKSSGYVGHDWFLNIGGMVTREKRGLPDEYECPRGQPGNHGFIQNKERYTHIRPEIVEDIACVNGCYCDPDIPGFPPGYETEPDVFHFNFMGYSGSFQFISPTEVKIFHTNCPQGEIKMQEINLNAVDPYIILQTGDGYSYKFGGTEAAQEMIAPEEPLLERLYPDAWYLTAITAPGGRKIIFNYQGHLSALKEKIQVIMPVREMTFMDVSIIRTGFYGSIKNTLSRTTYTKPAKLLSVAVFDPNAGTYPLLDFIYNDKTDEQTVGVATIAGEKLTSIRMRKLGQKIDFSYTYTSGRFANKKMLLSGVHIPGEGNYQMEYYPGDFPPMGSYAIDYWGYYNGKATIETFLPASINLTNMEETITGTSRNSDPNFSITGMLKKIVYPTKGYSEFEYESHEYSQVLKRELGTYYNPDLYYVNNQKGAGLRIKSIRNYDGSKYTSRQFSYVKRNSPYLSSGILLRYPRYGLFNHFFFNENEIFIARFFSTYNYHSLDTYPVEYSMVTETQEDGSKIEYHFSNYENRPDIRTFTEPDSQWNTDILRFACNEEYLINLTKMPNSLHWLRGQLLKKVMRDSLNQVVYEEQYDYAYGVEDYLPVVKFAGNKKYYQKVYCKNPLLEKIRKNSVYGGYIINISEDYTYNDLGQTTRVDHLDHEGVKRSVKYTYVHDLVQRTDAEDMLIARNIVNIPLIKQTSVRYPGQAEKLIESEEKVYAIFKEHPQLHKVRKTFPAVVDGTVYDEYDSRGNLLQSTTPDGKVITYIWGYAAYGAYPVAVIENAALPQILAISGLENLIWGPLNFGIESYEEALRQITGAYVTTYYYTLLGSLARMTDPAGRMTSYVYDKYGRLTEKYNDQNELLESYEYHVKE